MCLRIVPWEVPHPQFYNLCHILLIFIKLTYTALLIRVETIKLTPISHAFNGLQSFFGQSCRGYTANYAITATSVNASCQVTEKVVLNIISESEKNLRFTLSYTNPTINWHTSSQSVIQWLYISIICSIEKTDLLCIQEGYQWWYECIKFHLHLNEER